MSYGMPNSAYRIPVMPHSGQTFGDGGNGHVTLEPGFVQDASSTAMPATVGPYAGLGADDAHVAISEQQFEALASGVPLLVGAVGEQIRARRESMRGLVRQRAQLKKKISRSSGAKRQQFREELEMVNLQIEELKRMMAEAGDPAEAPGVNWLVLGGAAAIVEHGRVEALLPLAPQALPVDGWLLAGC